MAIVIEDHSSRAEQSPVGCHHPTIGYCKDRFEENGRLLGIDVTGVENLNRNLIVRLGVADADFSFSFKASYRISKKFEEHSAELLRSAIQGMQLIEL